MRRLCYALFLLPSLLFAQAAFDVSFQQVNAAGTEFEEKLVNPVASSLAGFDAAREISNVTIGSGLTLTAGVLANPGTTTTLNAILAATATQAGISNGDFNVRWNWAKTSNSQTAFEFGESAAATGGTSTSGVPNQVLGKFSTLAASTMSPLSVYSRGNHVFSVSPTTAQILATDGSAASPAYSFSSDSNYGLRFSSNSVRLVAGGSDKAGAMSSTSTGLFVVYDGSGNATVAATLDARMAINNAASGTSNLRATYASSSDSTLGTVALGRSRGSTSSPSVITTGDDLGSIVGFGYVGVTNTYLPAAQILFDSTGAIADSTTGIGGQIKFYTTLAGTDTAPQLGATIEGGSTPKLTSVGPIVHAAYTVAALPAAASYTYGIVAVSDATDAAGTNLGVAPTGGGAVVRMVYSDGANWLLL